MHKTIEGQLDARGLKFGVIIARFNDFISNRLLDGCLDCLHRHGAGEESVTIFKVPGSFEIPLAAKKLAASNNYDAVICLGTLIHGDTPHFNFIASEITKGIAIVMLETGKPVIYGVITADTIEQAIERAGAKAGNRGWDAAISAIEMVNLLKKM